MPSSALLLLNRPSASAQPHRVGAPDLTQFDPHDPVLSALDLAATRGDGIFETIGVGQGAPQALEHHLRRFGESARLLELPTPDAAAWRAAITTAIAAIDPVDEASVKIVLSRGVEGDDRPTGWAFASASPDHSAARRDGISVVTLDRGYRHDVETTSPWLLAGAKTLSYAVNRAVMREAARRDADDVIFVSSDGYVLEGPTSTVVYRQGDRILTPGPRLGILDGTTQSNIFRYAAQQGLQTGIAQPSAADLTAADAVWLASSVRLAAPVNRLDRLDLAVDRELTAGMNDFLLAVRE
ncbi:aminodeoxychorismate lyase [Glaciihabitans sp. INWT7]|uniref:aminodeoxychorismate lyase n=1 Tax=Glaciihabitans sp. INWT7 TaxID=2596912 RepID=UPI001628C99A|nr:aminodeoxychorismate lyase [Glaciihabitans sp. INWT7]QNE46491.1 aminodeoxychorismate lyase [Glaciihabitans sp. INWT7]